MACILMSTQFRDSGISLIGRVPWGTHFCQFYSSKQDLLDILVPYIKAGIDNNEACMWVTAEPLSHTEALDALAKVVPDLPERLKSGQVEVLPYDQWYLFDGVFDMDRVLDGWVQHLNAALARGFSGMRVTGNTAWLEPKDWQSFAEYEAAINGVIGKHPLIALCTYSLQKCSPSDVIDVVRNHQFTVIRREGKWDLIEATAERHARQMLAESETRSAHARRAEAALQVSEQRYRLLSETAGMLLSSAEPRQLISNICRKLMIALDCHAFFNYLVDKDKQKLHLNAWSGIPEKVARSIEWLDFGEAVCGAVARDGKPVIAGDIQTSADRRTELVRSYGIRAYCCHPIFSQGKVIGTLSFGTRSRDAFDADDVALMRVITDQIATALAREQTETALREARDTAELSRERLQAILRTAPVGIVIIEKPDGIITYVNPLARELYGMDPRGMEMNEYAAKLRLLKPDGSLFLAVELPASRALLKGENVGNIEILIERGDGSRITMLASAAPIRAGEEVVAAVGIFRDVTEIIRAREVLARINAELEARVKDRTAELTNAYDQLRRELAERRRSEQELRRSNSELQEFAYVISHDLQEPLRMITSYMQLIERRYKERLDRPAHDFIEYAVDGAGRMRSMINDLLEYSRVETRGNPPEPVNSREVLNSALSNLEVALNESGAKVTHGRMPRVLADPVQLARVFQNLIENAIKFRGAQPPRVRISAERRDGEWVFSVKDNGIGIEPQYHDRIFRVFQRLHTREEYPGTGIGLAICRRIIERHAGRIWLESPGTGKGATFYFTLPDKGGNHANEPS